MDTELIISEEELKEKIELTISETNRVILKWQTNNPEMVTMQEIKSVFFTWLSKFIRGKIGYIDYGRLCRHGKPCLILKENQIQSVIFPSYMNDNKIVRIFNSINYESLRQTPGKEVKNQILIDLEKLNNFKF